MLTFGLYDNTAGALGAILATTQFGDTIKGNMKKSKASKKPVSSEDIENFNRLSLTYYHPKGSQTGKRTPLTRADRTETNSAEDSKKRRFKWRYLVLGLLLLVIVPVLIIAIWDLRNFSTASAKLFGSGNIFGVLNTKPLKSTDNRVNLLLVGYSADDPGHAGAELTDSILVMSLHKDDPDRSYMLSVPRDLYVNIQDYGYAKINEAYQAGERRGFQEPGLPDGGMGLLRKTVSNTLGLELHYDALINYAAVREIVDALGGVTVTINSPDDRGLYDPNFQPHEGGPLKLANGKQRIDGETALKLTRARGATYGSYGFPQSDFNRTQNQQAVVAAILAELNWKLVLDPRTNGQIFTAAANNVQTDLPLSGLIPLYRLMLKSPADQLQSYTLRDLKGTNYLASYTTPRGQSALIPAAGIDNFDAIQTATAGL